MKHKAVEYEGSSFKVSFIFKQKNERKWLRRPKKVFMWGFTTWIQQSISISWLDQIWRCLSNLGPSGPPDTMRPWKISWRAGKPTVTLDITVTKAADYDNGKGKTFCSRSPEIFLSLFSSFTGSNQTRRLKISFTNDIDNIFTERQQGRQHFDNTKMTRDSKT